MATILEAVAADGAVQRLPMSAAGQTAVAAEPGYRYRLVDDAGGRVAASAQVKRIGGDLVVEGLEQDRSVVLEGFFTRCAPANDCALSLENLGGTAADTILPATAPIGALSGGGFLMYASGAAAPAIPPPPEAGFDFKPILGVAGGLAIVGGAGGGGGGGGSSASPAPGAPTITSSPFTNDLQPLFTGTAQAGSTLTLTIGGVVTYSTSVGGDGNWQIDTGTATPTTGTLPTLVEGDRVPVVALAANADGRPGGSVNATITLDLTPPGGPTISDNVDGIASGPITFTFTFAEAVLGFTAEDIAVSGGAKGAFTRVSDSVFTLIVSPPVGSEGGIGVTVRPGSYTDLAGNTNESQTGPYAQAFDTAPPNAPTVNALITNDTTPAITGTASAGDFLTVTVNGVAYEESGPTLERTGNTWTLTIPSANALVDGIYEIVARLADAAGNFAVDTSSNELVIDTTAPTQIVTISTITDNVAPVTGLVANGGSTNDTTPALSGTLSGALGVGELVEVLRNGAIIGAAGVTGTNWTFTDDGLSNGTYAYTTRVADVAGNRGTASDPYTITIDTTAPTQIVTINTVTDDAAPVTGPVVNGGSTNDTTPALSGSLSGVLGAGEEIQVLRNGAVIGTAEVSGTNWTFTDSGLSNGNTYAYTARIIDAVGNEGVASTAYTITIDTAAPTQTVTINAVTDDVPPVIGTVDNGGSTNDTAPGLSGTLSAALGAGEEVQVLRDGAVIGAAEVTGTNWTFTDGGLSNGNTYVYTARVADGVGHLSATSNGYSITVDTIAPSVTITDVLDDVVPTVGSVAHDGTTDDPTPTLELTFSEVFGTGASVEIFRNGASIGFAVQSNAMTASFTDSSGDLSEGNLYTYRAQMTDAAGNTGGLSAEYAITFQSFQLPPDFGGGP